MVACVSDIFAAAGRMDGMLQGEKAHIPQPGSIKSHAHNLPGDEYYFPLKLQTEPASEVLSSAYFPKYGDEGHELIYFSKGSLRSLPHFAQEFIQDRISSLKSITPFIAVEGKWRLTLNRYTPSNGLACQPATRPGFPYHKDLPANGDITFILTLLETGEMELVPEADPQRPPTLIKLKPGSLLLLSDDSRWRWLHRICPSQAGVGRMSVVFGWKQQKS